MYSLFQEIPLQISQDCQAVQDQGDKIYWLISLDECKDLALGYIHIDKQILNNMDNQEIFDQQIEILQKIVLPHSALISGFIQIQSELQDKQYENQQKILELIRKSSNKSIFTENVSQINFNQQCYITNKKWRDCIQINQYDLEQNQTQIDIKLAKYQEVSDVLRQYVCFGTYLEEQASNKDFLKQFYEKFEGNIALIQVKDQYLTFSDKYSIYKDPKQDQQEQQQNNKKGKNKKQTQQPTQQDILMQLVEKQADQLKQRAQELSKNCPAYIKNLPIDVDILQKQTLVEEIDGYIQEQNQSELLQIDQVTYFSIKGINKQNIQEKIIEHVKLLVKKLEFLHKQSDKFQNIPQCNQYYFQAISLGHIVSEYKKEELHRIFHLRQNHKFIHDFNRTQNQALYPEQKKEKLRNVDRYLPQKFNEDSIVYKFFGNYVFHHYMQDGFNDNGWGCAYRACMSVVSWFIENQYVSEEKVQVPSIPQIQKMLIEMGDKETNFLNSSQWIGAFEVSYILQKLLDIECKMLFLPDGSEINTLLQQFKEHFQTEGTPIMFGGHQYAYTLMGIDYNEDLGEAKYLILDPHYVGSDQFKNSVDKDGISWKKADLFKSGCFYNFCCPVRPKDL